MDSYVLVITGQKYMFVKDGFQKYVKCEKDANVTWGTKREGHLNVFTEVKQI